MNANSLLTAYAWERALTAPLNCAEPEVQPLQRLACPYCPTGSEAYLFRPTSAFALHQVLARLAQNPATHCLLLALPPMPEGLPAGFFTARTLRQWAATAESRHHLPISLYDTRDVRARAGAKKGPPPPCGDAPYCRACPSAHARSAQNLLTEQQILLLQTNHGLHAKFPELTPQQCEILRKWATLPDPNNKKRPYSQQSLADELHLSRGAIVRILDKAKHLHPKDFAEIEKIRKDRARITRGGQFDETRTQAADLF